MPSLADHHASQFVKLIYIGDSGTGKTGSLASLVGAGYNLKFLDLDNGLDALRQFILRDCPDKIGAVDYETRRDRYKSSPMGPIVAGSPKAFVDSLKLMEKWPDGTDPSQWGPQTIFVLDSLTSFGKAAFEWAKGMNPSTKDPRQWFGSAQGAVENTIALLTSEAFHCNVIVISHWQMRERDGKGYATAIGNALGPVIPRYFNTMILAESSGSGKGAKRVIKTVPTGIIDLKTPAPWTLAGELPLETGMATIFEKLKETNSGQ